MKENREKEFDENYSVSAFASALTFTFYFLCFMFFLNLLYLKSAIIHNSISGILILFTYYILSSVVLFPVLFLCNGTLSVFIKLIMKPIYVHQKILGFIIFPLVMSLIPFITSEIIDNLKFGISIMDYYYIYFATWISSIIQYRWLLENFTDNQKKLTLKQIEYLKKIDGVDYF